MNKGILRKLKYNYILQLESGLQFGTDEKWKQDYQSGTERVSFASKHLIMQLCLNLEYFGVC